MSESGNPDRSRARILADSLEKADVPAWSFIKGASLRKACAQVPRRIQVKFGVDLAMGAVVAALPYGDGPPDPPEWSRSWPGPLVQLGRFARANWYGELSFRLKDAASRARSGLEPASRWRYLANSGLPEKRLALAAGLGNLGRQGLVLVRDKGPGCVLGLLLLPFDPCEGDDETEQDEESVHSPGETCGSCRSCIDACPTRALGEDGAFQRENCLQSWTTIPGKLPATIEAAWGRMMYGCDLCLEACPRFRPDTAAQTGRGLLGPGLPASWFLAASDAEMRSRLHGTALGLGWMPPEAFRRNAGIAAERAGLGA
jgi:epoxyqueuosine reductase QueG